MRAQKATLTGVRWSAPIGTVSELVHTASVVPRANGNTQSADIPEHLTRHVIGSCAFTEWALSGAR